MYVFIILHSKHVHVALFGLTASTHLSTHLLSPHCFRGVPRKYLRIPVLWYREPLLIRAKSIAPSCCVLNHETYFYASLLTNAHSYSYMYIQRRSQLCLKNCEVDLVISVRCWVVLMSSAKSVLCISYIRSVRTYVRTFYCRFA